MALEPAGVQLIAAGGDVYITTINNATKATNTFVDSTDKGSGRVSSAGQVMIGALRQLGTIAVEAFAQAGKAAVSFVGDSIKVAGDFESGMHKFQAVAGDAVDTKGLEKFKDLFISLGKELPVSTSEVEQAAIEMVSGGIDPAIVQAGALRSTIQFAAASGLSLADAAATSAKFLAGWTSSAATTADKVAFLTTSTDALTKAAAASSTTAAELRLGIFNVQGAAQALHAPFTDVVATLAELAPAFESSAQAGTSLNVFMTRLVPQTNSAHDAMEALGLITKSGQNVFFDAQGNFLGMGNAAEVLKEHLSGLTDEQKISELHTLFGNDAMKVGNLLMTDGAAGIDAMKQKMDAANGVSATAALMQSGYNTALENAKGSVEALQITIGSALLPVLTGLMNNVIAPAVNTFTDMASAIFGNDDAFKKLSPSAQAVVHVIDVLVADMQEIIGAFREGGAGSKQFAQRIDDLATDLGAPAGLIKDIVSAVQDLVSWFGKTSKAGGDLSGVIDNLSSIWNKALGVVQNVANGYLAIVQSVLPIVSKFWQDHGTQIGAFFQSAYDHIIAIVNTALELYNKIVPFVLHAIAASIQEHATGIQSVLSGAWNVISGVIDGALTIIEGVLKVALDLINGNWAKAWKDIQDMSVRVVQDIQKVISGFLDIIAGFFNTNLSDIAALWQHNWDTMVDIISRIDWVSAGKSVVEGIISGIQGMAGTLFASLEKMAQDAYDAFMAKIKGGSPAQAFVPAGASMVQGIMQGFVDMWPALTKQVGSLSKGLIDDMQRLGSQMQDAIGNSFGATASIDRQIAQNLDKFKDVLPQYQQYTQGALKEAQQSAQEFLDPSEGAKFFKMRSTQILEYAKLQKDLSEAQTQDDKDRISAQMILINKAQTAEISQFDATKSVASPITAIADAFGAILKTLSDPKMHWTSDQITVFGQLANIWSQMQVPTTQPRATYNPGAAAQYPSSTSSYSQQSTYNMPVYTNQSPDALQQSWAVMQASMP